ncbi:hypothetical protein [Pedosphaera parvula]|uniref:Chromosome segregation ATPase-like protein n=1 Tax=Pedosphaera parvula (strain Ellin514) TaxID=320771 RepID=B9X9Z7_PEDPL|nr:hypothetical protein [Pedosphaera parvula]EEF63338.1 hypothetical protein Cflav_PD5973 [Pedosphaera parvula Ellin514]
MNILKSLSRQLTRSTPDVWVSRIAIYRKLADAPIRDVSLKKGLNIVWAEEPEGEDDKRDIAGHSAGKTTFCRLLRYVLGEKSFANKSNTGLIKKAFPNGYVGAELFVKGVKWAVLRPLGENRNSYVLKESTIEVLIEKKGDAAYQDTYPAKIGLDALLDPLESATVVRTNEPIKWGHLLAWCTRDQEARFQNIHDWRSPRSDSDWPAFRFPKSDPLFVMRVVLGLFLPDELVGEEALSKLQQSLERAEAALEVAKKEPAYWREHYDTKARQQLKQILPKDGGAIESAPLSSDEMLPDLKRYTDKAKYELGEQIGKLEKSELALQIEINSLNETIAANKTELQQLAGLFTLESTAECEASAGLKRNEDFRQKTQENKDKTCPFGDVLIGQCSYVLERQELVKRNAVQDAHTLEQMEAKRASARAKVASQQKALKHGIQSNELKRTNLTKQQSKLVVDIAQKKVIQTELDADLENLTLWKLRHEAPDKYAKLQEHFGIIEGLRKQVEAKETDLNRLLAEHDTNRDLLNTIFSAAAKRVLPSTNYDGRVMLEDRELHFQITHGGTMTGEAMETLAVLLADISCLIYNSFSSRSYLPGFLLHDSPREADLGLRLYRGFFRFAAQLESDFQELGGCPFQYIITTTTPPPKVLINDTYVALQLDASKEAELLFRRDLSKSPEKEQLDLIQ